MNYWHVCVSIFALLFFSGCIALPIPTPEHHANYLGEGPINIPTRGRIEKENLAFIVSGKTLKEEIILHLGEPDAVLKKEMAFAYNWEMTAGYLLVAVPGGGAIGPIPRKHMLIIYFDDHNIVTSFAFKEGVFLSPEKEIKKIEGAADPEIP